MKFVLYVISLFACLSGSLSLSAFADQPLPPIRIALDRAWHPLSYLDDENQPQGVLIDYWRLIARQLHRNIEFKLVDWQQSLDMVRDGQADVHGGLFESEARQSYLKFSSDLIPLSTRLFVSAKLNARSFSDLGNVQVGITRGGYEVEYVRKHFPDIHLKKFSNNAELVSAAVNGEVLAFVADYPVGMFYLHRYGSPELFSVVYTLYTKQLKTAVPLSDSTLLGQINTALAGISKDDRENVTQKWMRTETVVPSWLISSLIITALLIFLLSGFTYTVLLRIQVRNKTRQLQQEVDESVRLRNQNLDLVAELRKQKDEAEQANIAKSKFLAAASHDLRQPLHALALFTSILDESIQYPGVRKVVEQIRGSVEALQSLFNALLDISRLEAGVLKAEKLVFDLQCTLDKLANDFNPQAQEKDLVIEWPQCAETVYSDPTLLEQILRNYLSNALRYTETGLIRIECVEKSAGHITIRVVDTGVGIPEEEQRDIFREFHQLGNPQRDRSKGLGLGLAIVQRTAELLQHPIGLESRQGQGSCFYVTVERAIHSESHQFSEDESTVTRMEARACHVMVIDDEINVLEGTQTLLELWGCQVTAATRLHELLGQLDGLPQPQAIIADYRLQDGQTGLDAIKAIQTHYQSDIPALIVTGDTAADRLREVNNSGHQILHKPVAPARLRAFLNYIQRTTP